MTDAPEIPEPGPELNKAQGPVRSEDSGQTPGGAEGKPWSRAVLHMDMDAFYVNVHLLDHPEDAGHPLVVGGRPEQRGVVASASYEARQFGIHSAMASGAALRLCPQLRIVSADWNRIHELSRRVMSILEEYGPVEKMSVDEAYVDLTGEADPEALARTIRERVKGETTLPASVGLASGKLVAKVASDFEKPEGCTIVRPGTEEAFLAPQPVRAISGIGPRTAERLAQIAIVTCGQLATADPATLQLAVGRHALELQRRARGVDNRPVQAERGPPKSISQEWTFSRDVNDPEVLKEQLAKMAASVAASLQKRELIAHTVRVKFRWDDFTTFTRQKSVEVGIDDEVRIRRLALALWEEHWPPGQRVRLLGVGVSGLEQPVTRQYDFGF
jgi:DNA polymerase-4